MSDLPTNPQINALMVRKDHGAPEFRAPVPAPTSLQAPQTPHAERSR